MTKKPKQTTMPWWHEGDYVTHTARRDWRGRIETLTESGQMTIVSWQKPQIAREVVVAAHLLAVDTETDEVIDPFAPKLKGK